MADHVPSVGRIVHYDIPTRTINDADGFIVWCVHSEVDPAGFSIIDNANFVAISRDEAKELIEEASEIAWHFEARPWP